MLYFTARAGHTMTQMDNKLIVCGGKGDTHQSKCLSSVEIYHLDTDQWIYTSPMKYDCWAMSDIGLFCCKQYNLNLMLNILLNIICRSVLIFILKEIRL